ncbi:hypothetical protein [Pelomonas sp. Root1217]|nr:hypothetical protein [Pelomonas sp. Root1217]
MPSLTSEVEIFFNMTASSVRAEYPRVTHEKLRNDRAALHAFAAGNKKPP